MSKGRISILAAIDLISTETGSQELAVRELLHALMTGAVKAEAECWGAAGAANVNDWKRDASAEPISPHPIPANVWELADLKSIKTGRIYWSIPWRGSSPPWGNVPINYAYNVIVCRHSIDSIWFLDQQAVARNASAKSFRKKPGPKPKVLPRVIREMQQTASDRLNSMTEVAMEVTYRASRDTCRKAREFVRSETLAIELRQTPTFDK